MLQNVENLASLRGSALSSRGASVKMAAVESEETRCQDDVVRVESATAGDVLSAAVTRRQSERYQFRMVDFLYYLLSVKLFLVDVATDSIVFVEYLLQGHLAWGVLAMGLTILPACIIQLFSLRWYYSDGSLKTMHWLMHFLLLGFLHRYFVLLYAMVQLLRNKLNLNKSWMCRQENDICMLHLFKSFMSAMPQFILQLYVIITLHHAPFWTSASAITSFCSITWAMSAYIRAMHNRERNNVTWIALILQILWRSGMLLSRIIVLVLTVMFLRAWFLLFMGLHWLFMTIWVILQRTEFCSTIWEERIYNCTIGFIYCFDFFNLRQDRSRYRLLAFYFMIVMQNLIFLIIFALRFTDIIATNTIYLIVFVVIGCMVVGLSSMLLYYSQFHPSKMSTRVHWSMDEYPMTTRTDTSKSFKFFHRDSLISSHDTMDISSRVVSEELPTDKQFLLTNIAQISDSGAEEGIVNFGFNTESEPVVHVITEHEKSDSNLYEEIASPKDDADDAITGDAALSLLYQGMLDTDDAEAYQRQKRRGICLPVTHGLDTEKIPLENIGAFLSSWNLKKNLMSFLNMSNIDIFNSFERRNNSFTLHPDILDQFPPLESRIFNIDKTPKELQQQQQRDETLSSGTSIHDYENICPLRVARPPWSIRSWKGYTDIETYIHDDSVVYDRCRDTLTSTTGTTYSSEYDVCASSLISRRRLKQDEYIDTLVYDLTESKDDKLPYSDNYDDTISFVMDSTNRNATLFVAKPVVINNRSDMLTLGTIPEEHSNATSSSLKEEEKEKFQCGTHIEPACDFASALVSTIDQIRRYTAENSPQHVYHTTGTQWEDLNSNNLMARTRFTKVLFNNNFRNTSIGDEPNDPSPPISCLSDNLRLDDKCEIDAIRKLVKCRAIEFTKKTPLIDAILSDSPILGTRGKPTRHVTFTDRENDLDVNSSDLYVEMKPLVSVENDEGSFIKSSVNSKSSEAEIIAKKSHLMTRKSAELSDKENLEPIPSDKHDLDACDLLPPVVVTKERHYQGRQRQVRDN